MTSFMTVPFYFTLMHAKSWFFLFFISAIILTATYCHTRAQSELKSVHNMVAAGISDMELWLDSSFVPLTRSTSDTGQLRNSYREGRMKYKKISFLIDYFFPSASRQIIGAALDEIEPEENSVMEPGGFQVMEEILFDGNATADTTELRRQAFKMRSIFFRTATIWTQETFRDDQLFDAIRTDIVRIIALQLTGFDAPVSREGIPEIIVSLETYNETLKTFSKRIAPPTYDTLTTLLSNAVLSLKNNTASFDNFNRMAFIRNYLNPISGLFLSAQKSAGIPILNDVGAINMLEPTIFSDNVFDADYFIPDPYSRLSKSKIALGEKLFYDPILSSSSRISCATCHHPEKAFTDGLSLSLAAASTGNLHRNTPTLLYAGLQRAQFYDMRVAHLEDQVKNVIENKDEIHGDLETAAGHLNNDSAYTSAFAEAFSETPGKINTRQIQIALASYIRSLAPFRSEFDKYMRGDNKAMSASAINGFNLFSGKAKCATCHFIPLFNGTVPPHFMDSEGEVLGVMDKPGSNKVDPDEGRYAISKIPNFKNAFKTPTLRNISKTAPYMHHGAYSTLEAVMDFYNNGGAAGRGIQLSNQTLPPDSLHLNNTEINDIINFLKTLTDETSYKR